MEYMHTHTFTCGRRAGERGKWREREAEMEIRHKIDSTINYTFKHKLKSQLSKAFSLNLVKICDSLTFRTSIYNYSASTRNNTDANSIYIRHSVYGGMALTLKN